LYIEIDIRVLPSVSHLLRSEYKQNSILQERTPHPIKPN